MIQKRAPKSNWSLLRCPVTSQSKTIPVAVDTLWRFDYRLRIQQISKEVVVIQRQSSLPEEIWSTDEGNKWAIDMQHFERDYKVMTLDLPWGPTSLTGGFSIAHPQPQLNRYSCISNHCNIGIPRNTIHYSGVPFILPLVINKLRSQPQHPLPPTV